MKIAQGLLLRKQLERKVNQLEPIKSMGDQGLFEVKVKRINVNEQMDDINLADIPAFERGLQQYLRTEGQALCAEINRDGELGDTVRAELERLLGAYRATWDEGQSA